MCWTTRFKCNGKYRMWVQIGEAIFEKIKWILNVLQSNCVWSGKTNVTGILHVTQLDIFAELKSAHNTFSADFSRTLKEMCGYPKIENVCNAGERAGGRLPYFVPYIGYFPRAPSHLIRWIGWLVRSASCFWYFIV